MHITKLEIILLFFLTSHGGYCNPEIIKNSLTDFGMDKALLSESVWTASNGRWSRMVNWCNTSMDSVIFLVNAKERRWATFFSHLFPLSFNIYFRWVHWVILKYYQLKHQHYADDVQSFVLFSTTTEMVVSLDDVQLAQTNARWSKRDSGQGIVCTLCWRHKVLNHFLY